MLYRFRRDRTQGPLIAELKHWLPLSRPSPPRIEVTAQPKTFRNTEPWFDFRSESYFFRLPLSSVDVCESDDHGALVVIDHVLKPSRWAIVCADDVWLIGDHWVSVLCLSGNDCEDDPLCLSSARFRLREH